MNKPLWQICICLFMLYSLSSEGSLQNLKFQNLQTRDGLSNSQVDAIFKDNHGFMWFGTQSGLDRFDGFRFKNFFSDASDKNSLPANEVDDIQQDVSGNLWVHTSAGYCIYNYERETFSSNINGWMFNHGMTWGNPDKVLIDKQGNLWFDIFGKGCGFYNSHTGKSCFFEQSLHGKNTIPKGIVNDIVKVNNTVVLIYQTGVMVRIDGIHHRIIWVNRYPSSHFKQTGHYKLFVDSRYNYWLIADDASYVYSSRLKKWFIGCCSFLQAMGVHISDKNILIKDIKDNRNGYIWIATDHTGLIVVDWKNKQLENFLYNKNHEGCIPDNTLQKIYIDDNGAVWIGAYKNGVAYSSPRMLLFSTIPLGDICTICEDTAGNLWCGTNDKGIVIYNPYTGSVRNVSSSSIGLGTDVVVSSLSACDGSLYFGTYNGGMACYHKGKWKVFRAGASPDGLANDNVWSMEEDRTGHIWLGLLGGGLQRFDPKSRSFLTFNIKNSKLSSNYVSDLSMMDNGNLLIGISTHFITINTVSFQMHTYDAEVAGEILPNFSVNSIIKDSRDIFWMATPSGVFMLSPATHQVKTMAVNGGTGCSVIEDRNHRMWLVYDHQILCVSLSKGKGDKWNLTTTAFNYLNGLQSRLFNLRSILLTRKGNIIVGGQDGINIIHPNQIPNCKCNQKTIFSDVMVFDHLIKVGEKYNSRVLLNKPLDDERNIELKNRENAFTILLSSDEISVPAQSRFLYRLKDISDKWMITPVGQSSVSFTNLSSGHYVLQVKVVNGDGTVSKKMSELNITIDPPFYFSVWAKFCYFLLVVFVLYSYHCYERRVQKVRYKQKKIEEDAKKDREVNEMKLLFFTNISHELRTPLTLIISPLTSMLNKEKDKDKRHKLQLIHRNAERLLTLVNQILDFRKLDRKQEKLNLLDGDIVSFVKNVCSSFQVLGNRKIQFSFYSTESKLIMKFDQDKISKCIYNLLSNAYKFTPDGGIVCVRIQKYKDDVINKYILEIRVSDTGNGVKDKDKRRIFERFVQVDAGHVPLYGGSGIGLNITSQYVKMHGGSIFVEDNPGGGSVFIIHLPIVVLEKPQYEEAGKKVSVADSGMNSNLEDDKQPKKVLLLVDDSEDFRDFMKGELCDEYRVIEASDGRDALKKMKRQRPDIILCDVMMPIMDGYEFCSIVKSNTYTATIPVIMLTARLAQQQKIEGLQNGADDYITKPFSMDYLFLRIRKLISWSKSSFPSDSKENSDLVVEISELDRKLLDKIDAFIQLHMDDPDLTVEMLSSEVAMSRVQLYKRLVPLTGNTPSEYIRVKRLEKAVQLLHDGGYSVSETAYRVGFNNPRYFSKYFAETYGITPSQYKKKEKS